MQLYIDGASRNNPGPSGIGIYIVRDGLPLYQEGYFIGTKTNNQAEYLACVVGILILKQWCNADDTISIFSDSQLLIRQLKGIYKVRNEALQVLHRVALSMTNKLNAHMAHVMREDNKQADAMANRGIDANKKLPPAYLKTLEEYGISL